MLTRWAPLKKARYKGLIGDTRESSFKRELKLLNAVEYIPFFR